MAQKIALFWPGDYRTAPNTLAKPLMEAATMQMEAALRKLGKKPYRVKGFLSRPDQAIQKLGPIDDPLVGIFVHWVYGPHTVDGVTGKDTPLLLASNFAGEFPGLVGLLNTAACLEYVNRPCSRVWTQKKTMTADKRFMDRLEQWCSSGRIDYPADMFSSAVALRGAAVKTAKKVAAEIRRRRVLALMFGDTSMGMINGYFGPRFLHRIGFAEHKIDQAWIIERGRRVSQKRIEQAYRFVVDKGVTFHHGIEGAEDFTPESTKEQLRDYLAVLDMVREFRADCVGWQYQLGLVKLRPPSDFAEGLLNSACRPEGNGEPIVDSTEGDQGNLVPMELMKRLLKAKNKHCGVNFHDIRWGGTHNGRFLWVLLNSGSCDGYSFSHSSKTLKGVHSYRQPKAYFPVAGGTFAGEALPGAITWARAYVKNDRLWMDIGKGEVVKLPQKVRDAWWKGTTPEWPFMATDLGMDRDTLMAHFMSNHIAVAYGDIFEEMVALCRELGFNVRCVNG